MELAESYNNLGLILWERGRLAEAEAAQQEALALKEAADPDGDSLEANFLNNLANVLQDRGDFAGAESNYNTALHIVTKLLPEDHPHVGLVRSHLSTAMRRRGAVSGDASLFREALKLNPSDPFTADALAGWLAEASLTPLGPDPRSDSIPWRYSSMPPGPNWPAPDFPDGTWPSSSDLRGSLTYSSRSGRAVPGRTNLWLRREFELPNVPTGYLVLRINRNQDAEVYLNGVLVAPAADWSDANVIVPCSIAGQAALKPGRNVLALQCQDTDGGARIGVGIYMIQNPRFGRNQLIEEFSQMIKSEPQRAELYAGRANALARLGRWNEASADLARALERKPATVMYWTELAPVLVETGDAAGYRRHRLDALASFAKEEDPIIAGQVAKLSLLMPAEGSEINQAEKLADVAAAAAYADWNLAWRQFTKGLAEYRLGHFAGAIEWTSKALTTSTLQDSPGWSHERERNRDAAVYLVQAMAHQQLKQTAEARAALVNGTTIIRTQFPEADCGDLGREWQDWLVVRILSREAERLVGGNASTNTNAEALRP
jgi:tetratricopeptide (TPR) repeat protein